MAGRPTISFWAGFILIGALALVPAVATMLSQTYYITLFTRIVVFAIAAMGLNLILGYGGLVSFGHSLYIGIGAYTVAILMAHGVTNGWVHLAAAIVLGGVAATFIGLVCLRTSGVAFIMITLALAQMAYVIVIGLKSYGGDDGMPLPFRSDFAPIDIENTIIFYYLTFAIFVILLYFLRRLVCARFGAVLLGGKYNGRRMVTLGFPMLRYRLVAYVISALFCVIAGVLLSNLARYTSPSYLQWIVSGELIVMVVLGGMGTLLGPVVGAMVLLILEELLPNFWLYLPFNLDAVVRSYPLLIVGIFIVIVARKHTSGLYGLIATGWKQGRR